MAELTVSEILAKALKKEGTDANVQIRGVSPRVLGVRDNVKLVEGRFVSPGLAEAVVQTLGEL